MYCFILFRAVDPIVLILRLTEDIFRAMLFELMISLRDSSFIAFGQVNIYSDQQAAYHIAYRRE